MIQRQLKFRVWNPEQKCFYLPIKNGEPGYVLDSSTNEPAYGHVRMGTVGIQIQMTLDGRIFKNCYSTPTEVNYPIQQFTGLLDKNGKEIYEGDILSITGWYYPNGKVIFNTGTFCFKNHGGIFPFVDLYKNCPEIKIEVIGNVFENPELLNPTL